MLPRPYPDELIGSVISRAVIHSGDSAKSLLSRIFRKATTNLSFFFPSGINELAWALGRSPRRVLWEHTAFPYVAAYMPMAEVQRQETKALWPDVGTPSCSAALVQSVTAGLCALRYCPECLIDDVVVYGESFWHRKHCLPAVHLCLVHGCHLLLSDISAARSSRAYSAGLPQHQVSADVDDPGLPIDLLTTLAVESMKALNWNLESERDWLMRYRKQALDNGYVTTGGAVGGAQLATDLKAKLGEDYLLELGCALRSTKQPWPSLMVRPGTKTPFSPVKHIVLRSFLLHTEQRAKRLDYRRPGKSARDLAALDTELEKKVRRAALRAMQRNVLTTVQAIIQSTGYWQTFRHHRNQFPATNSALLDFRQSEASERKLGGREGHLRNVARRERRMAARPSE